MVKVPDDKLLMATAFMLIVFMNIFQKHTYLTVFTILPVKSVVSTPAAVMPVIL